MHLESYAKKHKYAKHLPDSTSSFMPLPKVNFPKVSVTQCYTPQHFLSSILGYLIDWVLFSINNVLHIHCLEFGLHD